MSDLIKTLGEIITAFRNDTPVVVQVLLVALVLIVVVRVRHR